jgi:Protein of unknown function (DUF5661)
VRKQRRFTVYKAEEVGFALGLEWTKVDLEQFRRGLEVELEHGKPETPRPM